MPMDYYEKMWRILKKDMKVLKEINKSKDWLDGFNEGFDFALMLIEEYDLKPINEKKKE